MRNATHRVLARVVVDADVGDVHGVRGRRDGRAARRAQHAAHEVGKGALLLCAAREALLGCIAAAVAVAVRLARGGRGRGRRRVHLGGEGARLAQVAVLGWLVGVRVLEGGPRLARGVQSFLDDAVEGLADVDGLQVIGMRVGGLVDWPQGVRGRAGEASRWRLRRGCCRCYAKIRLEVRGGAYGVRSVSQAR